MSVSLRVVDEAVRIVKQVGQLTLHHAAHHATDKPSAAADLSC